MISAVKTLSRQLGQLPRFSLPSFVAASARRNRRRRFGSIQTCGGRARVQARLEANALLIQSRVAEPRRFLVLVECGVVPQALPPSRRSAFHSISRHQVVQLERPLRWTLAHLSKVIDPFRWLPGLIAVALAVPQSGTARAQQAAQIEFFESRIRPVLVEHCYRCHNSADQAEGDLALDHREGLLAGGSAGPLIVSGDPDKSRLIAILKHEVEGLEMPAEGPKLGADVIADFEQWIRQGAADPRDEPPTSETLQQLTSWEAILEKRKRWWSFQPIKPPPLPPTQRWSAHPVDRFVAAKHQELGLSRADAATANVLIRRLYLNLIGMPPTAEETDRWQATFKSNPNRDDVIDQLIDELLNSRHFGEHWARHWMDWIRYAESHGSEGDPRIDNAWRYRDYLIRALNADVPFDQLLREHIAGDLLANPRIDRGRGINESAIGPAHWRMVFHGFAPTDALDEKVRFVDDQVNAFSKAFLGLTLSCARCHDHKFDAISQQDYYAIFGILAACRPARQVIDLPEVQLRGRDSLGELKRALRSALAQDWLGNPKPLRDRIASHPALQAAQAEDHVLHLLTRVPQSADEGRAFSAAWADLISATAKKLARSPEFESATVKHWDLADPMDSRQWTASGIGLANKPSEPGEFVVALSGDQVIRSIYPAGVYSHTLSDKDPARLTSKDFEVTGEQELWLRVLGDGGATVRYVVQDYPRSGTVYPVTGLQPTWKWQRYDLSYWQGDQVHIELTAGKDAPLLVKNADRSWFGITEARLQRKGSSPPPELPSHLEPIVGLASENPPDSFEALLDLHAEALLIAVKAWRDGQASDAQAELLNAALRQGLLPNTFADLPTAAPLIKQYRESESQLAVPTRVPGLEEAIGRSQPLYVRGNHKRPSGIVPQRFLEAIDETPYAPELSGRLQLADDLLREDNPFTRRVIVNRIWHHLFGRGIVATPDNFGRLGETPTHPELLDWLAVEFADQEWSMKRLIRLLVTSRTWQLSSRTSETALQTDPDNRYLARASVRRMQAESIRDSLLRVSGRLDLTSLGPPVDGNAPRRSVYVRVIRNSLDPFLRAFDFPEPFSCTGSRDATNVPAQSLTMMNAPRIKTFAEGLANRLLEDQSLSGDVERIERMFVIGLGRQPTPDEIRRTEEFLARVDASHQQARRLAASYRKRISDLAQQVSAIVEPTRNRLLAEAAAQNEAGHTPSLPQPIGRWDFEQGFEDAIGDADGQAKGGARTEAGELVVARGGHVVTAPLTQNLKAKTLEAWVRLDNLDQRGGGVMTVQTPDGRFFDSIVFGERDPRQWLAGSNNFARTEGFNAPPESEATQRFIHVAIVYHEDGRIVGYRDGQPYGKAYRSSGPFEFRPGQAVVSFGVRHLPAVGNRQLSGRIRLAQLYDRALSSEEVAATAGGEGVFVSQAMVLKALSPDQQTKLKSLNESIAKTNRALEDLGPIPTPRGDRAPWVELARTLFTFKEFIYVR